MPSTAVAAARIPSQTHFGPANPNPSSSWIHLWLTVLCAEILNATAIRERISLDPLLSFD